MELFKSERCKTWHFRADRWQPVLCDHLFWHDYMGKGSFYLWALAEQLLQIFLHWFKTSPFFISQCIQTDGAHNWTPSTQLTAHGISLSTTQAARIAKGTHTTLPSLHLIHCLDRRDSSGGGDGENATAKWSSDKITWQAKRYCTLLLLFEAF